MKLTFAEWKFVEHCIQCAANTFAEMMATSNPSDKESSMYQIFRRQLEDANRLLQKIKDAEI